MAWGVVDKGYRKLGDAGPERDDIRLNPLLLDLVLHEVFKFLKVEDLINCRNVSKHVWLPAATKALADKCKMVRFSKDDYHVQDMAAFLRIAHPEMPTRKFHVQTGLANMEKEGAIIVPEFFEQVGPWMTQLELYVGMGYACNGQLFPSHPPGEIQFKSLTHLKAALDFWSSTMACLTTLGFMGTIVENAPNLRVVTLSILEGAIKIVHNFLEMIQKAPLARITVLTLGEWQDDYPLPLEKFIECPIVQLTELNLVLGGSFLFTEVEIDELRLFFTSQNETLKKLTWKIMCFPGGEAEGTVHFTFPRLPKLKYLWIREDPKVENDINYLQVENVMYQQQFPALKSLSLLGDSAANLDTFASDEKPPPDRITELHLFEDLWEDRVAVAKIQRLFPKLKRMGELPAKMEVLEGILSMDTLEELTLIFGKTNPPDKFFADLFQKGRYAHVAQFIKRLYVLNLKPTCTDRGPRKGRFSNLTCRLVMENLPNLRQIIFHRFKEHRSFALTMIMVKEMKKKFTVTYEADCEDDSEFVKNI